MTNSTYKEPSPKDPNWQSAYLSGTTGDMTNIDRLWDAFKEYAVSSEGSKRTAVKFYSDMMSPVYEDLKTNYKERPARIFENYLKDVLVELGIDVDKKEDLSR